MQGPEPRRRLPALPKRLLGGRKAVTVAAGFRFAEGVLICADSEMTHGAELKTRGTKIFPYSFKAYGNRAVFTFSGDVLLSKQCIQKIARALASASSKTSLSAMHDTLAKQVYDFHQKYIFKHPNFQYGTGPTVNLIAGMWSADGGQLGLFESSEHAVIEVSDQDAMAITGTGGNFATYVARPLIPHSLMKLTDLITVAVYALKEAKDNVPGCGQGSELITLTKDGEIGNKGWLHSSQVESFADSFGMGVRHLFIETCDLDTPEEQVKLRFDSLWHVILATRKYLTREREKGEGFAALVNTVLKKKTTEL